MSGGGGSSGNYGGGSGGSGGGEGRVMMVEAVAVAAGAAAIAAIAAIAVIAAVVVTEAVGGVWVTLRTSSASSGMRRPSYSSLTKASAARSSQLPKASPPPPSLPLLSVL